MIVLASKSPRRKELLEREHVEFIIDAVDTKETFDKTKSLEDALMDVATQKAMPLLAKHPNDIILGADTIVVINNEVLGKPKNYDDAVRMLTLLSGKTHYVMTGVCIIKNGIVKTFYEKTYVTFKELSFDEMNTYITTENVYDKAGSYAIQEGAGKFVTKVEGDYDNIMGLPVKRVVKEL